MQGLKQEKEKIGDVSSLCLSLSLFICLCFLTGISCLNDLAVLLISFSIYSSASQLEQG